MVYTMNGLQTDTRRLLKRNARIGLLVMLALSLMAAPAAAQTSAGGMLCDSSGSANSLGSLVNTWLQMMFSIGIVAALGMFKYNTLVNMLTFNQSQKRKMKEKKSDVVKGVFVLAGVGPAFTILASNAGLGTASCITFIPWA